MNGKNVLFCSNFFCDAFNIHSLKLLLLKKTCLQKKFLKFGGKRKDDEECLSSQMHLIENQLILSSNRHWLVSGNAKVGS